VATPRTHPAAQAPFRLHRGTSWGFGGMRLVVLHVAVLHLCVLSCGAVVSRVPA
jgi:hypothetical protein